MSLWHSSGTRLQDCIVHGGIWVGKVPEFGFVRKGVTQFVILPTWTILMERNVK